MTMSSASSPSAGPSRRTRVPATCTPWGRWPRIVKLLKMGEDNYSLVVHGLARFRVLELVQDSPYLKARVEGVDEQKIPQDIEVEALCINLKKLRP